ncbi:heterokaryon incompatibility protein-domain-containing protein, partial [Clohesyomyces aquaticus]
METPRSIRLISLQPSKSFDHPLECELSEVELDHAPEYTALSYSWDSSEGTATILCDGGFLKVTKNCARALHRIRQREGSQDLNLWVDAICIDQGTDPEAVSERTQQIQIMGEIYKRASNVIAYVGEHDYAHGSKHVCEFFESVGRSLEIDDSILKKVRLWPRFTEFFREFFQRSWFTRMWPIQEVTLPRR